MTMNQLNYTAHKTERVNRTENVNIICSKPIQFPGAQQRAEKAYKGVRGVSSPQKKVKKWTN